MDAAPTKMSSSIAGLVEDNAQAFTHMTGLHPLRDRVHAFVEQKKRLHERAGLHRGGSPLTMPAFRAALAEGPALPGMGPPRAAALSEPPKLQQYAPSHRPPRMLAPSGAAAPMAQHMRPDIRWDSAATARGHQWARRIRSASPATADRGLRARELR